jgi:hypothetical protein
VWQAFQNTVGGDATLSRAEMEGASPWFWDVIYIYLLYFFSDCSVFPQEMLVYVWHCLTLGGNHGPVPYMFSWLWISVGFRVRPPRIQIGHVFKGAFRTLWFQGCNKLWLLFGRLNEWPPEKRDHFL